MAGGVIFAAWVQAAPIWVTAGAALVGLNAWRQQLRGQRQLEHAEKALAAGQEAFVIIRAVRGRFSKFAIEDTSDHAKQQAAYESMIAQRLDRAWDAWRKFADHYLLASLFTKTSSEHINVASALANCLSDLAGHAEMVFLYSRYTHDDPRDDSLRESLIGFRRSFYGDPQSGLLDAIETRLCEAEKALDAELRPILTPPTLWERVRYDMWN